ncbi:unnamed protein product [Allacma fusca]|uniref:Ig-like domain-containing protein n=1 Tax=Allacma fusca TaxID=39272 RepID=A0A8J2PCV1_9HEXA|nr:unnamed protein product [Allacma fusca]
MGTDVRVFKLTFFIFIHVGVGPRVITSDELCHPDCFCLDTFFDCRKRGLTTFPNDFPTWVTKLNLSSNAISTLDPASVSRLRQLEAISLDANNFSSIPYLGELPSLKQLSLSKNYIFNVSSDPFIPLVALEELDLSKNRIEALSNTSFPPNWSLKILNLAFNHLEVIISGWLETLKELVEINIAKNKLRILPKDSFVHLRKLEKLDLSRNKLEMIDSLRFQELKKLQVLSLRRNHLSNLSDGAFYGLETVQHLYLDGNSIKLVEKRWLYGLSSLKTLNLSKNDIGKIDDDSWEDMQELQILDLNSNKLESISKRTTIGLKKLRLLDLSYNQINEIEEDSFLSMERLEILDLSHNLLSWVVEDVASPFRGLRECHTLNLAANNIRSLHPQALNGLESLVTLNLTSNPIKWLSEKTFQDLPNTHLILADIDSFICDCQSSWLRSRTNTVIASKGKNRHRDLDWRVARKAAKDKDKDRDRHQQPNTLLCSFPPSLNGQNLFDLSTENLTCLDTSMRPVFLEEPKTEIFLMEGNGSLSCVARSRGNVPVTLGWKKDRKDLPKHLESHVSNLHRMEDNGGTTIQSTLQLVNISWNFAGAYQCVADNSYGVAYSKMVTVTVHIFPMFIKKPSNVTVRLGSNAKLECAAKGHPTPEIAFQKDGGEDFPAALDRRFHVMPNDDSFFIMEVKVSDMGVYCCSARNSAGEVKAYATVTVYDTPSFSDPMEDENAVEGNNAILACLASGSPKPQISWNKEGVPITPNKDKRFHFTENGSLLLIKDVQMQDAGRYECLLSNAVGTTRGVSTLSVLPNTAGKLLHLDTSAMTIIFIIIAVFCVVGTSAAWVVVIYRTRKRNKSSKAGHSKYDDDENTPGFSGSLGAFGPNCKLPKSGSPESDSQSSSAKDSGTGEDIPPESDPMAIVDVEHESLMRPGRRKTEMESFSTFGTSRPSTTRISQVRLDLQNDLTDVISLAHAPGREFHPGKRITKVSVPVPPDKELTAERRSTCPSNSSSSGYSSSGVRINAKSQPRPLLCQSVYR